MSETDPRVLTNGLASAGAALRAAQAAPADAYHVTRAGELIITDDLLGNKVLDLILAGRKMPTKIETTFAKAMTLARYVLLVVTHLDSDHPLVADTPLRDRATQ